MTTLTRTLRPSVSARQEWLNVGPVAPITPDPDTSSRRREPNSGGLAPSISPAEVSTQTRKSETDSEAIRRNALLRSPGYVDADIRAERVTGLRKWEGKVLEVDSGTATLELVPLYAGGVTVAGEIESATVTTERELRSGDVIYVTVRDVVDRGGISRTTCARLRRLGKWSQDEIEAIGLRAVERRRRLERYGD